MPQERKFPLTPADARIALIVVPAAVVGNWERELRTWGHFRTRVAHSAKREETLQARLLFTYVRYIRDIPCTRCSRRILSASVAPAAPVASVTHPLHPSHPLHPLHPLHRYSRSTTLLPLLS